MPRFRRKFDFSGGVNLLDDPRDLADNEWVELKNLIPIGPGKYGKRGALVGFGVDAGGISLADIADPYRIYAMTEVPWAPGVFVFVYGYRGVNAQLVVTDGINTSSWDMGHALVGNASLLTFNNRVFLFTGAGAAVSGVVVAESAVPLGAAIGSFVFNGTANGGLRPSVVFPYRRRLVYANFGPGLENYVLMSNDDDPETVGNDAINTLAEIIGARDADHIVAGREFMLQGAATPAQSAAIILKQYSCYFITGEAGQASLTGNDMEIVRLNTEAGCASQNTVVNTPYGIIWAGHENVWLFVAGSLPIPIGNKIAKRLKETPADKRYLWHAEYFNGFYRLAIMAPGQGPNDYAPCGEQWWLDLRSGAPSNWKEAKWYGPQVFKIPWGKLGYGGGSHDAEAGTHCMYARRLPGQTPYLFGMAAPLVSLAGLRELYVVTYDNPATADNVVPQATGGDSPIYSQYLTEITINAVSKVFTEGDARYKKTLDGIELDIEPINQVLITCDILKNGQTSVQTVSATVARQDDTVVGDDIVEMNLPLGVASQRVVMSNGSGTRQVAYDWQLQIDDLIGYYVKSGEAVLRFSISGLTSYDATVAAGSYDNIYELYEAIVAAMNAAAVASGRTFSHNVPSAPDSYGAKPEITINSGSWTHIDGVVWDTAGLDVDGAVPAGTQTATNEMPWSKASEFYLYGGMIRGSVIPREP